MSISKGTRFGAYEVVEQIGAGGMGEVYRATDTDLKRDVAIKALPASFASDADRLARFKQEAELLASLNHANIAQIYGLEKSGDELLIVMELVEGPTLADRIAEGPIPPDEALSIARQIAGALEAAHGAQVVHRDLKPANIKLRPDGAIKVLDFGIAKAIDAQAISGGRSPVMTTPAMTETGVILGTAAYMAPEQARGKLVDQRTDIWAFGCLLFEMLTGQPAFGGEDVMLTLARVLDRDTDMSSIPQTISPAVRHTIKLCLQKDPRKRLADIRDVCLALDGALESELPRAAVAQEERAVWSRVLPAALAAIAAAAITFVMFGGGRQQPSPEVRRSIHTVPSRQFAALNAPLLDVSPDGSQFVYAANGGLYLRRLSETEARPVPGSDGENPIVPSFSPDGRSILFGSNADGQLKRIPVEGGTPLPVMPQWPAGGWRWPADDFIYYGAAETIGRVPAAGGTAEALFEKPGYAHYEPRLLPGGEHVIVERRPQNAQTQAEVAVWSLSTGEETTLFPGKQAQFLEPGYLVYFEPTLGLMARSFDPGTLAYGNPIALVDDIAMPNGTGGAQFRISPEGDLIYFKGQVGTVGSAILALATENGPAQRLDLPARDYSYPSVSPSGGQVAVQIEGNEDAQIFVYDLSGDSEIRQLTFEGGNRHPAWAPDGEWISYSSNRDGSWRIWRQRADGTGVAEPLTQPAEGEDQRLPAWTPDGSQLAYVQDNDDGADIWIVSVPDGTPELLVGGEGNQLGIAFSPNGDAFAYFSLGNPAGLLVEPFPPDGSWNRISEGDDTSAWPVWSRDGTTLSYQLLAGGGFAAVDLVLPGFGVRNRRSLPFSGIPFMRRLDRVPGSDQMLVTVAENLAGDGGSGSTEIVVVENWVEELKQRLPLE